MHDILESNIRMSTPLKYSDRIDVLFLTLSVSYKKEEINEVDTQDSEGITHSKTLINLLHWSVDPRSVRSTGVLQSVPQIHHHVS